MTVCVVDLRKHRWSNFFNSIVLIGGLGFLLLLLVRYFFNVTWVSSSIAVAISVAIAIFGPKVSPMVLLRMYKAQKVTFEAQPALVGEFSELAKRAELPFVPALYFVPTRLPNAFAVGTDRAAAVAVTDGLLRTLSRRELLGVLAHEIAHIRHHDLYLLGIADSLSRLTSMISRIGLFLALLSVPMMLFGGSGFHILGLLLLIFAPTISSLLQLALSRAREYDADIGAVTLTGDPEGLASALWKLEKMVKPKWWQQVLVPGDAPEPTVLRTHPPTKERVRRLLELKRRHESPTEPLHLPSPQWVVEPSLARFKTDLYPRVRSRPKWRFTGLRY